MTQKFTTPCFIRRNTVGLRKKLEELGYRLWGAYLNEDLCIFTDPINGFYLIEFFSNIPHPEETDAIDCGTNDDLFLALVALREDNDYMQWFTNGTEFILCDKESWLDDKIPDFAYKHGLSIFAIESLHGFHKATAEELIEHFK